MSISKYLEISGLLFLLVFLIFLLIFIVYDYPLDKQCNNLILKHILDGYTLTESEERFVIEKCDPLI